MNLYNSLFPLANSWLLILSLAFGIAGILLCYKNKHAPAVTSLFFAAFFIRLFTAHLDSFLHTWDEQFHALVARNMMDHPFKPMLRVSDLFPYDYKEWCCNHIWLHKQPLFMWQMAISMKIFGVSEYAIRYPAVLMGSIGVVLVYRVSFLMTANKHIAFMAALLTCFSFFQLQLLSGYEGMDQNDCAFDFYVLCSIWVYAEYYNKKMLRYVVLIGLFAGCAILNKWLTGLLVYAVWGIVMLAHFRQGSFRKEILNFIISLAVCIIVFLPWQLYILHIFPAEAKYEFAFNARHLFSSVEGHKGDIWYYLYLFPHYFGNYLYVLLYAGIAAILLMKKYRNTQAFAAILYFVSVFVFFSFFVQTKIAAYFMAVAPLGYIFIAIAIYELINFVKARKYVFIPTALGIMALELDLPDLTKYHDSRNSPFITTETYNTNIYKNIVSMIPHSVKAVLNVKNSAQFMFYNNTMDAHSWFLTGKEIDVFKSKHYPIAVFLDSDGHVPYHLADYKPLYIIPARLR